jgi:hypothetical protein
MNFSDTSVVFDVKFDVQKGKEQIWGRSKLDVEWDEENIELQTSK